MTNEERENLFTKYFPDDQVKARAFEKLAKLYYYGNFGTQSKSEIDLLMFSEYLDRVYEFEPTVNVQEEGNSTQNGTPEDISEKSIEADKNEETDRFSNRQLSLILGITEGRVDSYKTKKELKYPSKFDWKKAFTEAASDVESYGSKVFLYVKDNRLLSELKARVLLNGGYPETSLTKEALIVSPKVFVKLLAEASDTDFEQERKKVQQYLEKNKVSINEGDSVWDTLKRQKSTIIKAAVKSLVGKIPVAGDVAAAVWDAATPSV